MNPLARTALLAADAAARIHRRDLGRIVLEGSSEKSRADYVSRTDLEAQAAALAVIRGRHPDHAVLAEEDERPLAQRLGAWDGGPMWVVDPLDGTANFLHGYPAYSASVAVAVEGRPVAGAVVHGQTGERWWAARGEGAWKGGRRISVAPSRALERALVGTGFPFKLLDRLPDFLEQLGRVLKGSAGVRRNGSAALDLCMLAQGSLDAFWELVLMPWDYAAGWILVEEAGGVVARVDGSEPTLEEGTVLAASTPELLEELGRLVRSEV